MRLYVDEKPTVSEMIIDGASDIVWDLKESPVKSSRSGAARDLAIAIDTHPASCRCKSPPRLAHSLTIVSLMIRYGRGKTRNSQHRLCSSGLNSCRSSACRK